MNMDAVLRTVAGASKWHVNVGGDSGNGGGGSREGGNGGGSGGGGREQRTACSRERQWASAFCRGHTEGNQVSQSLGSAGTKMPQTG